MLDLTVKIASNISNNIAYQIALNRKKGNLTQRELTEKINTKESVIARYEDPSYGQFSINTLADIAHALDIGLQVNLFTFPT